MKKGFKTKLISFTGYSGSGKTTFIVKLIKEFKDRGLKLAVIKHDAHEFQIDNEGKDTCRFYEAGADLVGIFSKTQAAMYGTADAMLPVNSFKLREDRTADALNELLESLPKGFDLIVIEGCRDSFVPKIGFSRKETGKGMSLDPKDLVAVITDEENIRHEFKFGIEDVSGVADFIISNSFTPLQNSNFSNDDFPYSVTIKDGQKLLDAVELENACEMISIYDALGRIVAQDYLTETDFPPFRRAPLDGYAFKASDTIGASQENPVTLKITEEIAAGSTPTIPIESGYAAKILTGAPVPDGADAIERYEATEFTDEYVKIFNEFKPDSNIVPIGEDYSAGTALVFKGSKIGPFELSILAMLGNAKINVYKKPVVSFISTGSELVDVEQKELKPGQIHNSSMFTLAAMAQENGAEAIYAGIVKDNEESIEKALVNAAAHSDIVFTTGGASAGDYDLVISSLKNIGAKILFWKAKMKPGMACCAAVYGKTLIIGLSGNPSSAAVTMEFFGIPMIRKLAGFKEYFPKPVMMKLKNAIRKKSPAGRYIRGKLLIENGEAYFVSNDIKGNGTTSANLGSNLMAFIPPKTDSMEAGTLIETYYAGQI